MPLPPTLNQTYRAARRRIILSAPARDYKNALTLWLKSELASRDIEGDPKERYAVSLYQYLQRNSRDVDANIKLVMDCIFDALGVNDNRVFNISLSKVVWKGCDQGLKAVVEVE